jgi:putative sporulation protein YtaF
MRLLTVLLLGLSVSLDALCAGVAYGLKGIHVPGRSVLIIGGVTVLSVAGAMGGGHVFGGPGATQVAVVVGACLLIGLGLLSVLQTYLTTETPRHPPAEGPGIARQLTVSVGRLVITIRAKPEHADVDQSQAIEPGEAALLGVALGLDNMVAMFAVSLMGGLPVYTPLVMGGLEMLLIAAGMQAAARLQSDRLKARCAYVSGVLLLALGVIRLV